MSLITLYQTILNRDRELMRIVKPRDRIAIYRDTKLDIMKVDRVGIGRPNPHVPDTYMVIAKVCPGQASFTMDSLGRLELNTLSKIELFGADLYDTMQYENGILAPYSKAHWVPIDKHSRIYRVRKNEMQRMLEELASQNKF